MARRVGGCCNVAERVPLALFAIKNEIKCPRIFFVMAVANIFDAGPVPDLARIKVRNGNMYVYMVAFVRIASVFMHL